jgi:hypothetical protein
VPDQVAVPLGLSAFDDTGALINDQQSQMLKITIDQLILTAHAMAGAAHKEERNAA